MDIEIFGKKFPMAYTVAAQEEIGKRFDGIENIARAFEDKDVETIMENMAFCVEKLMNGAAERERLRCKMMGLPDPDISTLTKDEIKCLVTPHEMKDISQKIMETIKEGQQITVEVEPEKRKNAKATQSK